VYISTRKRQELTTEGGLNVFDNLDYLKKQIERLKQESIEVSLFIDCDKKQIDSAVTAGANIIELHTAITLMLKVKRRIKN